MSLITIDMLLEIEANAHGAQLYGPYLATAADKRGIVSANAVVALLSNVLNESGALSTVSENLFYSKPERIAAVFSSHFPHGFEQAVPYTGNPVKLGNYVYAGIGPAQGGYAARGLGLGQVTGDAVHGAYAKDVGKSLAEVREYLLTPAGAADSACWYFATHGCAAPAEAGNLLAVRQKWAGRVVPNPIGWFGPGGTPGPVQTWAAAVRRALGSLHHAAAHDAAAAAPVVAALASTATAAATLASTASAAAVQVAAAQVATAQATRGLDFPG